MRNSNIENKVSTGKDWIDALMSLMVSGVITAAIFVPTHLYTSANGLIRTFLFGNPFIQASIFLMSFYAIVNLLLRWKHAQGFMKFLIRWKPEEALKKFPLDGNEINYSRSSGTSKHREEMESQVVSLRDAFVQNAHSAPDTHTLLDKDIEGKLGELDSAHSFLRTLLWAIPILGFVGTVHGISTSIYGFKDILASGVHEIGVIKAELGNVTAGLSSAFDTTLAALVAGLLVAILESVIMRKEEKVLSGEHQWYRELILLYQKHSPSVHPEPPGVRSSLDNNSHTGGVAGAIDATSSLERERLKEATEKYKKKLTDAAIKELENYSGKLMKNIHDAFSTFQEEQSANLRDRPHR